MTIRKRAIKTGLLLGLVVGTLLTTMTASALPPATYENGDDFYAEYWDASHENPAGGAVWTSCSLGGRALGFETASGGNLSEVEGSEWHTYGMEGDTSPELCQDFGYTDTAVAELNRRFDEAVTLTYAHCACYTENNESCYLQICLTPDCWPTSTLTSDTDTGWHTVEYHDPQRTSVYGVRCLALDDDVTGPLRAAYVDDFYYQYYCEDGECDLEDRPGIPEESPHEHDYLPFDLAVLPTGWAEDCPYADQDPANGSNVFESSDESDWGESDEGGCNSQPSGTMLRRTFSSASTLTMARAAYTVDNGAATIYYSTDPGTPADIGSPTLDTETAVAMAWQNDLHWTGRTTGVYSVAFWVRDTTPGAADRAWIDDISLVYCDGACLDGELIPFTLAEYDAEKCPFGDSYCPTSAWLSATVNANVRAVRAGTVVGHTQETDGTYTLTIQDAYGDTDIYANLAQTFVNYGEPVGLECVIGVTALYPPTGKDYFKDGLPHGGLEWARVEDGVAVDPVPGLIAYPNGTEMCGEAWRNELCNLNNPSFDSDADYWTLPQEGLPEILANLVYTYPRVLVLGDSLEFTERHPLAVGETPSVYVSQVSLLDPATNYTVTLWAERISAEGADVLIDVKLGTAAWVEQSIGADEAYSLQEIDFGPIATDPDAGGELHTLKIANGGTEPFILHAACIHEGSLQAPPSECFLLDNEFEHEDLTPPWTYTPGAGAAPDPPWIGSIYTNQSYVELVLNDSLKQSATLYEGNDGNPFDYTVQIRATPKDGTSAAADWATLQVNYTPYTHDFTINYSDKLGKQENYQQDTFQISADRTADFEFKTTALNGAVTAVELHWVCLTHDGTGWPGYDNDAIPPIIKPDKEGYYCVGPPRLPNSLLQVAEWVGYVGDLLAYLWNCSLVEWLNSLWFAGVGMLRSVYLLGVFIGQLTGSVLAWWLSLLDVLGGAVADLAVDAWEDFIGLPLIAAILNGLHILAGVLAAILLLPLAIAYNVQKLVVAVTSWVQANNYLITAVRLAINSASYESLNAPDCYNPNDKLYKMCQGLDKLDSIIDMTIVNALVVGGMGIKLAIWTWQIWQRFMRKLFT